MELVWDHEKMDPHVEQQTGQSQEKKDERSDRLFTLCVTSGASTSVRFSRIMGFAALSYCMPYAEWGTTLELHHMPEVEGKGDCHHVKNPPPRFQEHEMLDQHLTSRGNAR